MNPWNVAGAATRWMNKHFQRIGFKNIKDVSMSDNEFRILTKDNEQIVFNSPNKEEYYFNKFMQHYDHELDVQFDGDEQGVLNCAVCCLTCGEVIIDFERGKETEEDGI